MSACPVYAIDRTESHVARGRNQLIRSSSSSGFVTEPSYSASLSHCLLCKRCEAVCPARLLPASITLQARQQLLHSRKATYWFRRWVNKTLSKRRALLAKLAGISAVFPIKEQGNGPPLRHLADSISLFTGSASLPGRNLSILTNHIDRITRSVTPETSGQRVAFFPGCMFEFFLSKAGERLVDVLARSGCEVIYPQGIGCCGQAVHSMGDLETARTIARRNMAATASYDRVVTGCATCGSALKGYARWFSLEDPEFENAKAFSGKVQDFNEFIAPQTLRRASEIKGLGSVTYHDPCHLRQHQNIAEQPRAILRQLEGVDFIEMDNADACCGLGGSFGLKHRELSLAIQAKKIHSIEKTGAQAVVTSCPGCMINLNDGIRKFGLSIDVYHISELM